MSSITKNPIMPMHKRNSRRNSVINEIPQMLIMAYIKSAQEEPIPEIIPAIIPFDTTRCMVRIPTTPKGIPKIRPIKKPVHR